MVREKQRELSAEGRSLPAVGPALLDRHSGIVAKPYPYDGKTSWDVYYLQFGNIARLNNWSNAHLIEQLHAQLRNWTQQAKEDLTTFAYEVQSLAKRAFATSPIETQEYVAVRQFVEGTADLDVRRIERLSSPKTLRDALVKALEVEAAKRPRD
nr:unnamed protein product [Callosobruchus chinensis]